jgi:filamentous hemagglutinin family protein
MRMGDRNFWRQGLTVRRLVIGTAVIAVLMSKEAIAQSRIIPDNTLGAEQSRVTSFDAFGLPVDAIERGALRGRNLFHSFQEFSISEGRTAVFITPDIDIQNILARVTGNARSDILGTLAAFRLDAENIVPSNANFFLINPNGILFGPNASLNIGGSFVATTANELQFGNQGVFSAINPKAPSPLLTVNPSAFLFNQINPGNIDSNAAQLRVRDHQNLLLLGGNVNINGGRLNARGGRIDIGAITGTGDVAFNLDGSLSIGDTITRADTTFRDSAIADVRLNDRGNVRITARNITLTEGSLLQAGILSNTSTLGSQAGNLELNATESIQLSENSRLLNAVGTGATGNGGNIILTTNSLTVTGVSQLDTSTRGQGNAGSIMINARDTTSFDGRTPDGQFSSGVLSSVAPGAVGNGGDIRITTGSLLLTNGAQLSASTLGQGNAGNVIINARDIISLDAGISNGQSSNAVFTRVEFGAVGNGGDVRITTGSLLLTNASQLLADTRGQGNAGSVIVDARNTVSFNGTTPDGQFSSGAFSNVEAEAIGNGGDIRITASSLSLANGARLRADTLGRGDAGNIVINAHDTVSLDGRSAAISRVETGAVGNGGDIRITTGSLSLSNASQLDANTRGQGNAGDVIVEAHNRVFIDGVDSQNGEASAIFTRTGNDAVGRGGDVTITTDSFHISNGAIINAQTSNAFRGGNVTINANTFEATSGGQVITTTANQGQAGNITLNIRDTLLLEGADPTFETRLRRFPNAVSSQGAASGLYANTSRNSRGQGGTIRISTNQLRVEDRARVEVNSLGSGAAGDVQIQARSVRIADEGRLIAETQTVDGGSILLTGLEQLVLREQSSISTNAGTTGAGGDGGNIDIDADFIVAVPSENSDITANAVRGNGGRVDVTTQGLFGIAPREFLTPLSDITASSEQGVQGVVAVNTPNVDPRQGLLELPTDVIDATQQIAQNCPRGGATASELGEFVITGRGGLPPSPIEVLGGETVLTQLANTSDIITSLSPQDAIKLMDLPAALPVEAQGWVVGSDGIIILFAQPSHAPTIAPNSCHDA